MHTRLMRGGLLALALITTAAPESAAAQGGLLGRVKRRVEENVNRRAERAVDCVMGDQACIDKAKAEGREVKVDSTRAAGATPASGAAPAGTPPAGTPEAVGTGAGGGGAGNAVWTNYDFVPGTRTIFAEDFSNDQVGNFPRRYEFVNGNVELVTYRERTWLRFTSTGQMYIPLPQVLPERYTIEMDFWGADNVCWIFPSGKLTGGYRIELGARAYGGVVTPNGLASGGLGYDQVNLVHMGRIMVDGTYIKVYVNERRVANVPNFNDEKANRIGFYCDGGMALGGIRVAEGGRKLYDALAADGRVATQGIYFDTGSDRIRPESAPTLREIADMLVSHADLRLGIEGHTDNVGMAPANLALSRRRAEAVKAYLVTTLKADAARLEATGFGASKPSQPNTTPEGRQTNRRVELVKLP
ncbi:MAG: OmpA family protein [Gemmatimonadaceae bacterium]|nr:OmpA family protein [Gemmatimonadaceae bacterium]